MSLYTIFSVSYGYWDYCDKKLMDYWTHDDHVRNRKRHDSHKMNACDACIVELFGLIHLIFFIYFMAQLGGALQPVPP